MSLTSETSHPGACSYVLKLHRDARPQDGLLFGKLENLRSGRSFAFGSSDELLRALAQDARTTASPAPEISPDGE